MHSVNDFWPAFAASGLVYLWLRASGAERKLSRYEGFGVWVNPPRWARIIYGSVRRRIRWEIVIWESALLIWCGFGILGAVLRPADRSIEFLALALPIAAALVAMFVVVALVEIGRRLYR